MFRNRICAKFIAILLCFTIFFPFVLGTNVVYAKDGNDGLQEIFGMLMKGVATAFVGVGDAAIHLIAVGTGEVVTIDKLVFNDVGKLSIDYWDDIDDGSNGTAIKNFMKEPVKKWYKVFQKIALMVYMIVLVYIGIAIMLSSTGEKKAKYKELTVMWFTGIAILLLFPYVMKYVIRINDAMVDTMQAKAQTMGFTSNTSGTKGNLAKTDFKLASADYGKTEFGDKYLNTNGDIMAMTRHAAIGGNDEDPNLVLVIVYLILIGQMLAVLVMYYKRAFMLAFLITIFPLVAMTYVLDKIGDGKNQSFNTWFKEFLVNVIVQMFHAVVYVLITGSSINSYLNGPQKGSNFIFLVICILFLFEGEKILRTIFGIKSKASTITDLAASGAIIMGMASKAGGVFKRDGANMGSSQDRKDDAYSKKPSKTQAQQNNEKAAQEALDEKEKKGESTKSRGEYQGEEREPEGVAEKEYDGDVAKKNVLGEAMKRRLKGGLATQAVKGVGGLAGATLGATKAMATDGFDSPDKVLAGALGGKNLGQTFATPLAQGVNAIERRHAGNALASKIRSGKMDKDLGLDAFGADLPPMPMPDSDNINPDEIANKHGDSMQDIYREALAAYAKAAARGGRAKGEKAYFDYIEKNTKK